MAEKKEAADTQAAADSGADPSLLCPAQTSTLCVFISNASLVHVFSRLLKCPSYLFFNCPAPTLLPSLGPCHPTAPKLRSRRGCWTVPGLPICKEPYLGWSCGILVSCSLAVTWWSYTIGWNQHMTQRLEQGGQTLSLKAQEMNSSGFVHHTISITTAPFCHPSRKAATDEVQMNKCGCVPILYLWEMKA